MVKVMKYLANLIVQAMVASVSSGNFSGPLLASTLKVGLFTNTAPLGDNMAYADFTAPLFPAYAEITMPTWGTPYLGQDGNWRLPGATCDFVNTADAQNDTVRGYFVYVTVSSVKHVLYAEEFPSPVLIVDNGNAVVFTPEIVIPADTDWGECLQAA